MNKQEYRIETINNMMNLRLPQYESLQILDRLMGELDFTLPLDELETQVHALYPTFRHFERSFPSLCFALATGVGKTLLMGAFITYLYTNHGVKNFFIVAPNLTIYNKLIEDFGSPAFRKYVFKRLNVFVQSPPTVITGDTYQQHVAGQTSLGESVTINIFNIGKINAEVRGGSAPQVKRLWEYIGESYFDYLAGLPDLVVLMDESHHYRADRGMAVINELDPFLGLELTATPQTESSKGAKKFQNVVYEYSLARAIVDGYVKVPAAATRRDFDPKRFSPEETDRIKLSDGIRIHRNTKAELELYAQNQLTVDKGQGTVYRTNSLSTVHSPLFTAVKPFVLVVCRDTGHAAEIKEYITSDEFYGGYYADKVIEVHSAQRGAEKDENIARLVSLEAPENDIEIVIHVNMLKEGWDVTNLYTIIPLRTAASLTLREQTIGRGLRLPYGERTGNPTADRLTIVAHDKFDEIIAAANDESSIIRQENIISIEDDEDYQKEKEVIQTKTVFTSFIEQKAQNLKYARSEERKAQITEEIETAKAVGEAIEEILAKPVNIVVAAKKSVAESTGTGITASPPMPIERREIITSRDLNRPEVRALIQEKAKEKLEQDGQISIEAAQVEKRIEAAIAPLVEQRVRYSIDIPDIVLMAKGERPLLFDDFELDTYFMRYSAPSDEIIVENLRDNEISTIGGGGMFEYPDTPENIVLNELLNLGVPYRKNAKLLYMLIGEAVRAVMQSAGPDALEKTVFHYKAEIARQIYDQLMLHTSFADPEYEVKVIKAAAPILPHGYTKYKEDEILKFTASVAGYEVRHKVFGGYEKACHTEYKFDSVPEHTFAVVLERDGTVLKWLRPAPHQFKIWWEGSKNYEPDFVAETEDAIHMIEIKGVRDMQDEEVKLKAKAAAEYCRSASLFTAQTGGKPWRYALIAAEDVKRNSGFAGLVQAAR
ncbi:DEAD/DEAH box helicase family protein [Oscillospiraceae bacterium OttesenSCG-928-F05]|nr:DEAD/DEAH box helicase family protein [Oscillospiraceae bacterium OttesenSCG-928-F05]